MLWLLILLFLLPFPAIWRCLCFLDDDVDDDNDVVKCFPLRCRPDEECFLGDDGSLESRLDEEFVERRDSDDDEEDGIGVGSLRLFRILSENGVDVIGGCILESEIEVGFLFFVGDCFIAEEPSSSSCVVSIVRSPSSSKGIDRSTRNPMLDIIFAQLISSGREIIYKRCS